MTKPAEAVLAEALRPGGEERTELVAETLASLDRPADPDAAEAWADEIRRRIESIESEAARLESWDEVRHRLEREIPGR